MHRPKPMHCALSSRTFVIVTTEHLLPILVTTHPNDDGLTALEAPPFLLESPNPRHTRNRSPSHQPTSRFASLLPSQSGQPPSQTISKNHTSPHLAHRFTSASIKRSNHPRPRPVWGGSSLTRDKRGGVKLARTLSRSHKIPTLCLCDYGSVAVRFDPSATTAASFLCQDTNSLLGRLETRAGTGGGQAPPHTPKFIRSTNPNSLSLRFVTGMNAHHHHPTLKPPALSTETPPPNVPAREQTKLWCRGGVLDCCRLGGMCPWGVR